MKKFLLAFTFLLGAHFIKAQLRMDSLDIKIGQMILIGFPGTTADSAVLNEISQGKVGSIIIFEKNIPPQNSFIALKKIIWTYQHAAPIPLFIGIDQEGGRVNRLKDKYGFPKSITAWAMGHSPTLDSVRFYGESTASTLAGLGININFAPDVDLASNPNNPIIAKYGRAFSANEDSVAMYATEFIKQHHKVGVLTALKHFPGHGSSKDDTHIGLTDVTNTWEERELKPYQILIDSGYADAVMTSHIVNKKLDKNGNPGTLSEDILTGILRNKLNFKGVVFTDDMQMHAITNNYGLEEAIRLAIVGGVDIMTFSNNISGSEERTVDKVHTIIRSMVQRGLISRNRIDESFKRIMYLKSKLNHKTDFYRADFLRAKEELKKKEEFAKQKAELEKRLAEEWEKKNAEEGKKKKRRKKKD
ncbi:MAG TPA: glycoside hydrolase family 3 N-terminal domain-containing protein [Cyclobacteriaceae bacterium]|jgi:beta-N-acetylhexosaminidase|nr:glycoside hydrolase family 3 N-terminal domain-containing protein [Cyclobacteriaceae bacterium]